MKIELIYLKGQSCDWASQASREYVEKINYFLKFSLTELKSKSKDRDQASGKRRAEAEILLSSLEKSDHVILFDEKGKSFSSSVNFSSVLVKKIASGHTKICFIIGGPYGFDDSIRSRANDIWSLSPLTMNHHLARVAVLEQLYRALTIWKGLPYHN